MTRRLLIVLALVAAAGAAKWQTKAIDVSSAAPLSELPFNTGAWRGYRAADYSPDVVNALGVDDYVNRAYVAGSGRQASLYVGYYRSQERGGSIHSPLNCLPGAGWEPERVVRIPFGSGTARQVVVRKGTHNYMVMYWYQTATRVEGDEYRNRLYTVLDTLRYRRNDAALVRVMVPMSGAAADEPQAVADAMDLSSRVMPDVQRLLFPVAPQNVVSRAGPS
ncbi:MAG: exosortase C-terminal domain/associated protein EpsI [Acidobacteriota bacterium]